MKSNLDSLFKTDSSLENEGVWFMVGENVGFKVRRFGGLNAHRVRQAMSVKYKPFQKQSELGVLSPEVERKIMVEIFVESCLITWEGVEIDGAPAAFSKEAAVKLFMELPELFGALSKYASEIESFKESLGKS